MADDAITWGGIGSLVSLVYICGKNTLLSNGNMNLNREHMVNNIWGKSQIYTIHQRYQTLRHLDPIMGLNLGVL